MTTRPLRLAAALLAALALGAAGCVTAPPAKNYDAFKAADPHSILIVPVVNNTGNVEAPSFFLSTLPVPVAELGYYVFPTHLVMRMLEDDGLSDANLVHQADPVRLCGLFGADSVLYVTIQSWNAKYLVFNTTVEVSFEYVLKDGKTGTTLWNDKRTVQYSSGQGGGSSGNPLADLVAMAVAAAVTKAAPDYMPLARQANDQVLTTPGVGLLYGPYHPQRQKAAAPVP
ncbi:MAG TPA: GNA1162 family protein [Anaeromyxobacter sp.]|nr:GNA1162 family protein [Anaeromyxobacter sp.]